MTDNAQFSLDEIKMLESKFHYNEIVVQRTRERIADNERLLALNPPRERSLELLYFRRIEVERLETLYGYQKTILTEIAVLQQERKSKS